MTPLPRQAVFGAAAALFGAAILGLYVGVHDSLDRPVSQLAAATTGAPVAMQPGMASAIMAQPLKPEALAPSSTPVQVAAAKPKAAEDEAAAAALPASSAAANRRPIVVEPPPLYSPDAPPAAAPPPPPADNTPPF